MARDVTDYPDDGALRRLIDDCADAVLVFRTDNRVVFANRAAGILFQRPAQELVGRRFDREIAAGDRSVWRISEDDGPPTLAEVRLSATEWAGAPARLAMLRDVTARADLEKSLRTAVHDSERNSQAKGQLLADLGHEVRTTLNAILGFTQFIQTEPYGPVGSPKYREYLEDIHSSGSYLVRLVNDLLDLSRAEAGRLVLNEEQFSMAPIVNGAVRTLIPTAAEAGVELRVSGLDDSLLVYADQVKIRQVLLNLLTNAIKYTPENGTVHVGAHTNGAGACVLTVSDTGIGMASDYISSAFTPFRRFDNKYTRSNPGTGLGLALSKRLVELHGGCIRIVSDLGRGTTVTVTLPARRVLRSENRSYAMAG